jgi:uncharacterized membrane protein (DUF373 family)
MGLRQLSPGLASRKNHPMMDTTWFEKLIVRAITFLLMVIITVSTLSLFYLFAINSWHGLVEMKTSMDLQESVQRAFGGIFVVLLGLELLETLKTYLTHHRFRLEVVLVVGSIAVARHIIQLDFEHISGGYLAGLGVLIASLVSGYFLLQKIPESKGGNQPAPPAH